MAILEDIKYLKQIILNNNDEKYGWIDVENEKSLWIINKAWNGAVVSKFEFKIWLTVPGAKQNGF